MSNAWSCITGGIPDSMFERGQVPMTKEEVRSVALSKLRLHSDSTVVDIGAGTGSVSIEAALVCKSGIVHAIDKSEEAARLIEANARRFGVKNINIIKGTAPEALDSLGMVDRVFIGGSTGRLEQIFSWMEAVLQKGGRVAANFITIENAALMIRLLEEYGYSGIDIVHIGVSRGRRLGSQTMMNAENGIYIISADWM
ncbi:precorrin-6Y C5,15-methyltransferase CbiT (plasmid) [Peptoclostridium acidaminophilum DSM 3953]|uniref:Precorrin-6Y C5,15-methyltransferase CbiT n=1 Tax=Peptoclostridium acidaminophilum DSM 3953 TaxID=1286171 RepID=W8TIF5_PEPAC|nr:precorrin-6Y C5,15-methyltransferase (decarboxylating) subunit CbiT [Peptoclostridium acidaminophilum]AHM57608.1 precorrin-6Y C5,15-methyltransferase CbiT [Peptoclostridium acidaminophilum DSM 3953]